MDSNDPRPSIPVTPEGGPVMVAESKSKGRRTARKTGKREVKQASARRKTTPKRTSKRKRDDLDSKPSGKLIDMQEERI